MARALKRLHAIQWALLASILILTGMAAALHPSAHSIDPSVSYVFTTLAVAVVGVVFVVRRTLVFRAEATLSSQPDEPLSLTQWRAGYVATYALCEALALFGFAQRCLGSNFEQSVPYYFGGFVLLFFFRPRRPQIKPVVEPPI